MESNTLPKLDPATMTDEQKTDIARRAIAAPMKRGEFAAHVGVSPNTLALWIKKFKVNPRPRKSASKPERTNQVTVFKENERSLAALQEAVEISTRRYEEILHELEDTKDKMAALQKVILVLGHQLD